MSNKIIMNSVIKHAKVLSNGIRMKAVGLEDMLPAVVTFGLIAIVAAVVALILSNFSSNSLVTANSIAYNSIQFGLQGVQTMTSFLSLIALVIVAAIIIGIVLLAFSFGRGGGAGRQF